jgi:hypothetical protein
MRHTGQTIESAANGVQIGNRHAVSAYPARLAVSACGLLVGLPYALPLLLSLTSPGFLFRAYHPEEVYYSLRVVEASRGGSLGNPYLAGHEAAAIYLPEMVERGLAFAARALNVAPLNLLALSRVLFPVAIFFVLYDLSRRLGAGRRFAVLAAVCVPLALNLGREIHFLRYFRTVSPSSHVLLMLVAVRLLWQVQCRRSVAVVCLAGAAVGLLFYTPPYYWSFVLGALVLLVVSEKQRQTRIALLTALLLGLVLGLPYLFHAVAIKDLPAVRDALALNRLLMPGRWPDAGCLLRFAIGMFVAGWVLLWRARLGPPAHFLLPFLLAASFLLIQDVFTNLHMQSGHWRNCLAPFCGVAVFLLLEKSRLNPEKLFALAGLLFFIGALLSQAAGYRQWRASLPDNPGLWLDRRMPETIAWLNANTPPGAVVLSREDVSCTLPLFTHNKVYWCEYAQQYALEGSEALARRWQARSWASAPLPLTYRADYYLGIGTGGCQLGTGSPVYENPQEATCLYAIHGAHGK